MFTLMTMICFGSTFNQCVPLVLNTRMEESICLKEVEGGIDSVQLPDGKWYDTKGLKFSCVREV